MKQKPKKQKPVVLHVVLASGVLGRSLGLLTTDQPYALLIKTRFGIHTLGMRFPIDVIVLDAMHRIVKIRKTLRPGNIFLWHPRFDTVVELPAGTIEQKKLRVGVVVQLLFK